MSEAPESLLEVDFENYTLAEERATTVRSEVQALKSRSWLIDLIDWVNETGTVEAAEGQGDLLAQASYKVLRWTDDAELSSCTLHYNGLDLEIKITDELILSLQKLPKGDEFLLTYVHPQMLDKLGVIEEPLQTALKAHSKVKAEKTKAFQEKMSGYAK